MPSPGGLALSERPHHNASNLAWKMITNVLKLLLSYISKGHADDGNNDIDNE